MVVVVVEVPSEDRGALACLCTADRSYVDLGLVDAEGRARFLVDAPPEATLELQAFSKHGSAAQQVRADVGEVWLNLADPSAQLAGGGLLATPPAPYRYPGRISSERAASDPSVAAGRPEVDHLRVDETPRRGVVRHMGVEEAPPPGGCGRGTITEYEVTTEPLGWALDEWVATDSLPPGVELAKSSVDVSTAADATQRTGSREEERSLSGQRVASDAATRQDATSEASATSAGVSAGLGRTREATTGITLDPVLALTQAVTGAIQIGAGLGASEASATSSAAFAQQLRSAVEQDVARQVAHDFASAAGSRNDFDDQRSLRILRNPHAGSLNRARFGVSRVWLVTTVKARTVPVVLAPIVRVDQSFTEDEIFAHRTVLRAAMTHVDPDLVAELDVVAAAYGEPEPSADVVDRVDGSLVVGDSAEGRHSSLTFGVWFRSDPPERWRQQTFTDIDAGSRHGVTIEVNRELSDLARIAVRFNNPGGVRDDWASIARLDLTAVLEGGGRVALGPWEGLWLPANTWVDLSIVLVSENLATGASHRSDRARRARARTRVLAHLNAHRSFYRLALDLARDSVARHGDWPSGSANAPSDLVPMGVAGGSLAFAGAEGEEVTDAKPRTELVSTPTGATWEEAMPGAHHLAVPDTAPTWWPSLPRKEGVIAWPAPFAPALLAAAGPLASAPATEASEPPPVAVVTKQDIDDILAKLADLIAEAKTQAEKAVPKIDPAKGKSTEGTESTESPAAPGGDAATDSAEED